MADKYKKQTHREHILSLPDTYIGSIETAADEMFVVEGEKFVLKTVNSFNPGFYKLFDEILVNAHDHVIRTRQRNLTPVKNITIEISPDNDWIYVENDGEGIDVVFHEEHNVWVPQMIFGELLSSTNYDKNEKKLVGGKNGYGVKLANIFSKELKIETIDATRAKKYTQTWKNNMTVADTPKIAAAKGKPFVSIKWYPDFARFGMTNIPTDFIQMLRRRATDLAMTVGKEVKVHWKHGEEKVTIKCRDLGVYAGEHVSTPVVYAQINDRWAVAVADTPVDKYFNVSFVNGIWTSKGGTHVDYITNQVVSHITDYLETKKKIKVKPSLIKENLAVFVTAMIENPSFNSQTKETLTTKSSAFGSTCKLPEEFLKKIQSKLDLVNTLIVAQKEKDEKDNKKSDGRKQSKIYGIPKLDDAGWAGTAKSSKCTLILTEGDSAKAMALSGLTKAQRDMFGVFPLRGKLMNVKDSSASKVELAKEIADLKKIIGLESGKKYKDTSGLRYGSVMIMTDQDYDGSHIRGLLINLFHELWHELMTIPGFLTFMATPIVKATKGKQTKVFYTQFEYDQWKGEQKGWSVQYYKGLGTSTREEAKEYFKDMNVVSFKYTPDADPAIDLAFNKARADDRKAWLQKHDPSKIIVPNAEKTLQYDEFVHKDLIHFSHYNLERSIPSVMDGLKTSQRKILFAALKRNLTTKIKVAQLAGYVSEHSGYHHGEASLNETIIGMAQDFMGSNNLAWLVPQGQFGTRLDGGSDSAAPRYIFTHLQPYIKHLVPSDDLPLMNYRDDDGLSVEPDFYAPVLPMILVNGARGIGTGYSTFVPSYNPSTIAKALNDWLVGDCDDDSILEDLELKPFVKGFTGKIEGIGKGDYIATANYKCTGKNVIVTDLPPGTWTADFKQMLDAYCEKKEIVKDYVDTSTDTDVHFEITLIDALSVDQLEKALKLTDKIKTSNMHVFDSTGRIKKYATPNEMLVEYAHKRIDLYKKRKEHMLKELRSKLPYHENVVEFIRLNCDDEIDLRRKTDDECATILEDAGLIMIDDSFDYLLKLPMRSLTKENIEKHEAELKSLKTKIDAIEKTYPHEMWIQDLSMLKLI
jgi:DNA topoisomerase II